MLARWLHVTRSWFVLDVADHGRTDLLLCSVCFLPVLLGTVFPSHGTVEMSVSTGLLVVAFSVEMVERKKNGRGFLGTSGRCNRQQTRSLNPIYLNYRKRALEYITSLRRCHLNLH